MANPGTSPVLSIVVPCYNEELVFAEMHKRITAVCALENVSYEIIYVNDGSRDRTWNAIEIASRTDKHVVGVDLSRNYGHQCALSAGLEVSLGQEILCLDADLQDPPELLPEMRAKLREGYEIVIGKRTARHGETPFKRWTAYLFYRILQMLCDMTIPADAGDFRLMSRKALNAFLRLPERNRFIRGMISWIGFPQAFVEYERSPRFAGETKYPLLKMIQLAIDAITSFSVRPLRLATLLGSVLGVLSLIGLLKTFVDYFENRTVAGWSSLMVVILVTSSAQLLVLGVIGEYLGRIFLEAKGRPLFFINHIVRHPSEPPSP